MNPVLLKPESDTGAQVILQGAVVGHAGADYYRNNKAKLLSKVVESFDTLREQADIVLVEGAGSPAEVNLRAADIANMGFAVKTQTPVVLAGDINRGGVIAAVVGTYALLSDEERALVCGTIINQFRGDISLFGGGLTAIEERTGWRNYGVVPFLKSVRDLPAEDAVVLDGKTDGSIGRKQIAVPMLPRIANFDDLDPLQQDEDIDVVFCPPGTPLPQSADLIVIPGSKATILDLQFLKAEGWATDIHAHVRTGKPVFGLCGGYQMLGRVVHDPDGIEGVKASEAGLGLLDVETTLEPRKNVGLTKGHCVPYGCAADGYEIHAGKSQVGARADVFVASEGKVLGACSADGKILGTYLHGIFSSGEFRQAFLTSIGFDDKVRPQHSARLEAALNAVAEDFEQHLDIDGLIAAAR